jgi:hypothetical protein
MYVRATIKRAVNFRSAHTRIVLLWREGNRSHRPEHEIFTECQAIVDSCDVTNYDRTRLSAALYALREYSVMTHARWQLYIDDAPVTSDEISRKRESGDADVWLRVKGRHEYDESHDPYYENKTPEWLHSSKRRSDVAYEVYTGRPSWHQQRAGAISAAIGVYETRNDAERYVENFRKHHPDQPCFIREVPLAKQGA